MARPREELQKILEDILGSREVYYQPPASIHMEYPAIVYNRYNVWKRAADNTKYTIHIAYNVVLIDRDPDSVFLKKILDLPYCQYGRHYTADNLNHDSFTLYF